MAHKSSVWLDLWANQSALALSLAEHAVALGSFPGHTPAGRDSWGAVKVADQVDG